MKNHTLTTTAICFAGLILFVAVVPSTLSAGERTAGPTQDKKLAGILEPLREKHKLPALAAAVISSKGLQRVAAVGSRKRGDKTPVTVNDQWHIGSDTKAMTATLIGKLVEETKLRFNLTLGDAFPDHKKSMAEGVAGITLQQLLTHRSGFVKDPPGGWWVFDGKQSVVAQRRKLVAAILKAKPAAKPGEKFLYSNVGYVIAAAMAERVTKQPWETLMAKRVFAPLKINSAGFGPAGSVKNVKQPWPHNAKGVAYPPTKFTDNPAIVGPAGRVHVSLPDWSRFLADQLAGARGVKGLLKSETYKSLLTPQAGEHYAPGGWIALRGGRVLSHDGSNTFNYCTAWLFVDRDLGLVVVCNQGGAAAKKACHEGANQIVLQELAK